MTKAELIKAVSIRTGIEQRDVGHSLEFAFDEVIKALKKGQSVQIRGFVTITPKLRKAKIGQNMNTGASVVIPAKKVPVFKAHFNL